jgi:hypothetical protein
MENQHRTADGPLFDTDISVRDMTFDYGDFASVATPGGGKHALRFEFASNIVVQNNTFQVRGAEDAVAGLGVDNMVVRSNRAYEFRNCAFDFWYGPSHVKLIDNYALTVTSAQMVNFNPERTTGDSAGMVARDLVMSGNTLLATGPKAVPIQIEPLGSGTAVRIVSVTGNKLRNVYLVLRGNVQHAVIRSNSISDIYSGTSAIETYPHNGSTPDTITLADNDIVNVNTATSELGVLRIEATHSTASGNFIGVSQRGAPAVYRGSFRVPEH